MIKFFRKIRQKLLSENKFSKYLIYAIGEIILVVIGILIALSLNNWNSLRLDHEKEQIFLKQILEEFTENSAQLKERRTQNEKSLAAINRILNDLREGTILERNLDSLSEDMFLTILYYSYNPTNGSVDALVNSASFSLIRNEELRLLLLQWKDLLNDYIEIEKNANEQKANIYKPYLINNFKRDLTNLPRFDLKSGKFDRSILQSIEFENQIIERMIGLRNILDGGNLTHLENHLNQIIYLAKQELDSK